MLLADLLRKAFRRDFCEHVLLADRHLRTRKDATGERAKASWPQTNLALITSDADVLDHLYPLLFFSHTLTAAVLAGNTPA